MGKVFKSPYRQPPTPAGLRKIETNTMDWFDIEMYSNFNSGVLEQYFEEKNKTEGFHRSTWTWWKILVGIIVGALFAAINQYVGLKVGMVIGGSWYISYLIGMGLFWKRDQSVERRVDGRVDDLHRLRLHVPGDVHPRVRGRLHLDGVVPSDVRAHNRDDLRRVPGRDVLHHIQTRLARGGPAPDADLRGPGSWA